MPRGKHVKITIAADGTCRVDAVSFAGPSCQALTGEIAAALGGQIDHQHAKPEARLRASDRQDERERAQ